MRYLGEYVAGGFGVLAIIGWMSGKHWLTNIMTGYPTMKISTAVCVLIAALLSVVIDWHM